jgi:predicted DnaQ family exonuclease/DinG family helicase
MKDSLKQFVAIDVETTGLLEKDRVIEIGVFKFDEKGKEIESLKSFVNPQRKLPKIISSITGIYPKDLSSAPEFSQFKDRIVKIVGDCPIVGHNLNFDLGFLKKEGLEFVNNKKYDTWKLAMVLLPQMTSYSLEILVRKLKIKSVEAHRALEDARACASLFLLLKNEIKNIDEEARKRIVGIEAIKDWELRDLFLEKSKIYPKKNIKSKILKKESLKWEIESIEKMFTDSSSIKNAIDQFEFREEQVELASTVANIFENKSRTLIEGGANLGKRFAYLIAAAYYARTRGVPVVIATSNFKLRNWILDKEIPILKRILPFELQTTVLESREKYLDNQLYEKFKNEKHRDQNALSLIVKIELWIKEKEEGNLDKLATTFEERKYLKRLGLRQAERDDFRGYYQKAKEKAQKSDLIFVTHRDLLEQNEILEGRALIIDEGHLLEKGLEESLKKRINIQTFTNLKSEIEREKRKGFEQVLDKVTLFFGFLGILAQKKQKERRENYKVWLNEDLAQDWDVEKLKSAWEKLDLTLETFLEKLGDEKKNEEIKKALIREKNLLGEVFKKSKNNINWIEIRERPQREISLVILPTNIQEEFYEKIEKKAESVIIISANLTTRKNFEFIRKRLGLDKDWVEKRMEIKNYGKNITLLLAKDMPEVETKAYFLKMEEIILEIAQKTDGKILIWFNSTISIKEVYKAIFEKLKKEKISLLAQQITGGKAKILDIFKKSKRVVLLVSSAFLEEKVLKDPNLKAVLIAKLAFETPNDPVVAFKMKEYENGFLDFLLPQAILKFKREVEKIARLKKDKGIILVLDNRLISEKYGIDFIESLSEMKIVYGKLDQLKTYWG